MPMLNVESHVRMFPFWNLKQTRTRYLLLLDVKHLHIYLTTLCQVLMLRMQLITECGGTWEEAALAYSKVLFLVKLKGEIPVLN